MKATDKIMLFKPARIAELIGDPDALTVLKACWQRAATAAWTWAMNGDISQPWPYADPMARGQVIVDARTTDICAALLEADDSRAWAIRSIMSLSGFEQRQFHRDELARWIDAMDIDSDYAFRLAEDDQPEQLPAGGSPLIWTEEKAAAAWDMRQRLRSERAHNFMAQTAAHFGVSTRRLTEVFKQRGWM